MEPVEADHIEGVDEPQYTSDLVGHVDLSKMLLQQSGQGRLPGGLLLHGPRGIGKATLAFKLAREVLAATGDEDAVRVDEQVFSGAHPNLYVLRRVARESGTGFYNEIRVNEVRGALAKLQQTRGRAGHRFLIVDAVDDCNINAANALLKTLEEPPADTHIILVSHRPGRLLPTIRSRCQAHAMRPLDDTHVQEILDRDDIEQGQLEMAISYAGGRPRRAFEALGMGDSAMLKDLSNWLQAPQKNPPQDLLKLSEALANKKLGMESSFAREMVLDWIVAEAKTVASASVKNISCLASVNQLWEKANKLFEQTDSYNLDVRQGLIILFDEIVTHAHLCTRET